jgi:DNA topoisomerase-1
MALRLLQPRRARIVTDPARSARKAGLRYVSAGPVGIRRRRAGRGFVYLDPAGRRIRDARTLRRVRALVIPPAWRDVWICPIAGGHLQAVGRDARGRKQYRYHPRWRTVRDETKYTRMLDFARTLPRIRARVARDLARPGLPREKVLAAVVRLLETTLIRVGNEEYVRANRSFGLTTLRTRHADVAGSEVRFEFRGKGGKVHAVGVRDPRVARVVRRLQDLPGQELFQYLDADGVRRTVGSADVNAYLREIVGADVTAKDFRTWAGTVLAAVALDETRTFATAREGRRNVVRAIERVAARLGNTPAVCRKSYVHPVVLEAYLGGATIAAPRPRAGRGSGWGSSGLDVREGVVLALLRQRPPRPAVTARAA